MSGIMHVGRLERKFVFESAGTTPDDKLRYNDPSFITFRVLFDFEPLNNDNEVTQGLLLSEDRDESAISYLRRTGEQGKAEALKEFRWLLSRVSDDFPWFFKQISGLEGLWKWGYPSASNDSKTQIDDVTLTLDCYETVDLRMTALADLYRKASWDRLYFRELLPLNKRRFNMTVIAGEARYLKTFVQQGRNSLRPDWLNHVSAIAFRCFDCEFDFSSSVPAKTLKGDEYTTAGASFNIKVGRVQEANSYKLLNYMLGEMKRDLIIKQGGSGASFNDFRDVTNYRSFLAPFIREYENNYENVIASSNNNIRDYFLNNMEFTKADTVEALPREERERIRQAELNSMDMSASRAEQARTIMQAIESSAGITGETPRLIEFGRPSVTTDIRNSIEFERPTQDVNIEPQIEFEEPKLDEDMPNQVEFMRPKVETEISNVNLVRPSFETTISSDVNLQKPKVDSSIGDVTFDKPKVDESLAAIEYVAPTVATEINDISFELPTVSTDISNISFDVPKVDDQLSEVKFTAPTVDLDITEMVELKTPSVEFGIGSVEFNSSTTSEEIIDRVDFQVPSVVNINDVEKFVNFGLPTVLSEDSLTSIELRPAFEDTRISSDVKFNKPKVEEDFGS
jgi:hypothetical protein